MDITVSVPKKEQGIGHHELEMTIVCKLEILQKEHIPKVFK